jgi:hypothetical protein
MSSWEPYRIITDLEGLREVFCDRAEDLNISRVTIDEAGGLTPGYSSKLLCEPPMKPLTNENIPKMLKATRLVLIAVIDDERFAATKTELSTRKRKFRAVARIKRVKGLFNKENAAEYGKKRWLGVSALKRSRIARKAANARHRANRRRKKIEVAQSKALGASIILPQGASCQHDHP